MSLTQAQARDEILEMITDVWPDGRTLIYDDVPGEIPDTTQMWGRATVRHLDGGASSLSGALGKQRYTRIGLLVVQIFTPTGKGLSTSDEYVKIVMDAFDGKKSPGGVWFRNGRSQEVGPDGAFYQVNVSYTFEYDEIK